MGSEGWGTFAEQVADLNRYGQALNSCESVEEVVSLTIEATSLLFEFPAVTFVEVRNGTPEIANSTTPGLGPGDDPCDIVYEAIETGETVRYEDQADRSDTPTYRLAVPGSIVEEVVVVITARAQSVELIDDERAEALEILSSHAATAISNIRSREELERARNDLETRKEMVELYDRLLRHDLGNDLQVISGFADAVADRVDGETRDYVERIERAADGAADLIERVGNIVSTLESAGEPEPKSLRAELNETVADVSSQYDELSIQFDPAEFDYRVYGGDLLDSVFTNLLSNAAIHNETPVTVRLYAETPDSETVVVGFADDGGGIPAEIREDLFEMGRKGPESTGTGLGLGFVRALVESYGGTVSVRDSASGGADFRVSLEQV